MSATGGGSGGSTSDDTSNLIGSSEIIRAALRLELAGRVEYNVDILNPFLRVGTIQADIIDRCVSKLHESNGYYLFRQIVKQKDKFEGSRAFDEHDMYEPLVEMFDIIEREGADVKELNAHRRCMRKILVTTSKALDDEGQGLPNTMPDMRVVDVDPTLSHAASVTPTRVFHRQAASFIEIKIDEKDEPEPKTRIENFIKRVTAQVADYAGLHFASRPFQIFVISFVIYGRYFRAALFTHANVYFSEKFDILTPSGLEMLIRVIRSITWQLTDREMGLDPAVSLAEGYTFYGHSYPSFVVRMTSGFTPHDHPPSHEFTTNGPPLWSSLSWLGRSTSIWKCMDGKILKVAWRNEKRMGETDIYGRVGNIRGVARLVDGGDVLMMTNMGSTAIKLDCNYIIKSLSEGSMEKTTKFNAVLHRVVLDRVGKPLWSYSSIEELVRGLLAALAGHRRLSEIGILHRDISPGNVYLWDIEENHSAPSAGDDGFIADLELASVPLPTTALIAVPVTPDIPAKSPSDTPQRMVFTPISVPPKSEPRPSFTGTAQFIAKEILDGFVYERQVVRDVHHDLESFLLVIIYSFYRRSTKLHPHDMELRDEFYNLFGKISPADISAHRSLMLFMEDALPELKRTIGNAALCYIIAIFCRLIQVQNLPKKDTLNDLAHSLGFSGAPGLPVRQLITYDEVVKHLGELLSYSERA